MKSTFYNTITIKYADNMIILERLTKYQPSSMQQEMNSIHTWYADHDIGRFRIVDVTSISL